MENLTLMVTLGLSLILNSVFCYNFYKNSKKAQEQKDMRLLQDLMSKGRVLIEIKRIAPEQFFLRSPRDL